MKALQTLLIFSLVFVSSSIYAEVYRWKDASGRVFYGDTPPQGKSLKPVDLPALTIADGSKKAKADKATKEAEKSEDATQIDYSQFKVTSPSEDQAIRANSGIVSVSLGGLEQGLKQGDEIVLYVDGKQQGSGSQMNYTVQNLDRGNHSVFAVIKNPAGDIIQNTAVVNFHVLRISIRS